MEMAPGNTEIVVIILTLNQRTKTLQCLSDLLADNQPPFRVLVWDNGSTDGTADAIRTTFPNVLVHHHLDNLGVAGGRNAAAWLAIELLAPAYLLFLDNDILVEPGFVGALHRPLAEGAQIGQTQAKLRLMNDKTRLNDGGGAQINFLSWQVTPVGYGEIDRGQYDTPKECVSCGGAMMVRAELFQRLGGFDMIFNPFGPEDLDFSLRLQQAGFRAFYVPTAVGYHEVSHTFGKGYTEEYARHKARHWLLFMRRHAAPGQKVGFFLVGAPYLALRILVREGKRGNLAAVRGLMRGVIDLFKRTMPAR